MLKTILIISTFSVVALASRLTILKCPKSVSFKGNDRLESESLADVLAATLGYSVTHPSDWTGLYINDPFNPASAVVTVVVDGVEEFNHVTSEKTYSYELIGSGAQESLDSLVFRVQEHNAEVIDLDLTTGFDVLDQYSSILGDIKPTVGKVLSALKPSNAEHKLFLEQISVIDSLTNKIESLNVLPKYVQIRLSMTPLITSANPAVTDALKQLSASITGLTEAIDRAYNKNAVVAVVTTADDTLTRSKRATSGARVDPIPENLNLALSYSDDYPVIFNIILWFSVVLTFSLLAISYTIGYMDPGRDSIIYRMTSTRMKKDN
jgi:renin receptor